MNKLAAVIVDDEKQARDGLKVLLARDPKIEVIAVCRNGMQAIDEIARLQPDLLFLDIQMPEINGFEVLNSLPDDILPAVIFATAYDKYALQAFEVHAIDYLLKPFTDARFFEALERAKQQIRGTQTRHISHRLLSLLNDYQDVHGDDPSVLVHEGEAVKPANDRLVIKSSGKIHLMPLRRIHYFESSDYFVTVHAERQEYMVRESLKSLVARLPESQFFRIHRSTVVNLNMIQTVQPHANGDFAVTLRSGRELRGSRKYRRVLFDKMGI